MSAHPFAQDGLVAGAEQAVSGGVDDQAPRGDDDDRALGPPTLLKDALQEDLVRDTRGVEETLLEYRGRRVGRMEASGRPLRRQGTSDR
jgi:hypothetical protein